MAAEALLSSMHIGRNPRPYKTPLSQIDDSRIKESANVLRGLRCKAVVEAYLTSPLCCVAHGILDLRDSIGIMMAYSAFYNVLSKYGSRSPLTDIFC